MWPLNDSCYQGSWTRKSIECHWRGGINAGQIDHSISFSSWFDVPGHTHLIGPQTALNTLQEIPLSRKIQQASRSHGWQAGILSSCWQLTLIKSSLPSFFDWLSSLHCAFYSEPAMPLPSLATGNTPWQSSLSLLHSLWVHQTAKTNTLIIRTRW